MASVSRPYRLVNPGRRKRKNPRRMSLAQKLHFGTKRQRAAAKASLGRKKNPKKYKGFKKRGPGGSIMRRLKDVTKRRRRKKNVGSILTVFNPGAKKGTSMKRRRRNRSTRAVARRRRNYTRRRRNPVYRGRIKRGMYKYSSNPHRRRRRRSNPGRSMRRYHRRRNPDFLTGEAGIVVGVVGGASLTSLLMGTLQSTVSAVSSGFPAYIAGAVVAFLQGKLIGKFTKNPQLGKYLSAGGYTWVAYTILHDLLPAFPNPFANLSGMGLLTSSNNWGPPWVNVNTSMTRFVRPGGVVAAIPPPMPAQGMHGLGRVRRGGRIA